MNSFALIEPTTVTIEHINLRDERHGDDSVPAIDLKLSMEASNEVLALFDPEPKRCLYCKGAGAPEPQQSLDGMVPAVDLPNLRWPHLDPLKWSEDLTGRTLTIDYGLGGESCIRITDCTANNFRIEPKEGGTVRLTWRVQRSQPDERAIGKLAGLLKRQVEATLVGSPAMQAVMAGGDEEEDDDEPTGTVVDATDAFVARHGEAQQ